MYACRSSVTTEPTRVPTSISLTGYQFRQHAQCCVRDRLDGWSWQPGRRRRSFEPSRCRLGSHKDFRHWFERPRLAQPEHWKYYQHSAQGSDTETISLNQAVSVTGGASLSDNYQLNFSGMKTVAGVGPAYRR